MKITFHLLFLTMFCSIAAGQTVYEAAPTGETEPVTHSPTRVDDACIWVHPSDASQSTFICTDKNDKNIGVDGLRIYDLSGTQIQFLNCGEMNNVDIRYNFPLGGESVTIVTAGNRTDDSIAIFKVDPSTRLLTNIAARTIPVTLSRGIYGSCMYLSPVSGKYYVFANSKSGSVEQWELFDTGSNTVDATMVRTFDVGAQVEGCVADDELGWLYVGEEDVGIWKYGAEPDAGTARTQVDTAAGGGHLIADVEGLTLYYSSAGGYLIASSQGEGNLSDPLAHTFAVYDRTGTNAFLMNFKIVDSNGIDAVTMSDGVDVCGLPLGTNFPYGVFIAHDDENDVNGGENFKLVPWENIATLLPTNLLIDTEWNPRDVGNPNGDTDGDGISNEWEATHFGGSTSADPDGNADGDRYTNRQEYIAGLNPTNSDSFQISAISNGQRAFQWNAVAGRIYDIYCTTNLLNGFPANPFTNVTGGAYTDLVYAAEQKSYYRIDVRMAD